MERFFAFFRFSRTHCTVNLKKAKNLFRFSALGSRSRVYLQDLGDTLTHSTPKLKAQSLLITLLLTLPFINNCGAQQAVILQYHHISTSTSFSTSTSPERFKQHMQTLGPAGYYSDFYALPRFAVADYNIKSLACYSEGRAMALNWPLLLVLPALDQTKLSRYSWPSSHFYRDSNDLGPPPRCSFT